MRHSFYRRYDEWEVMEGVNMASIHSNGDTVDELIANANIETEYFDGSDDAPEVKFAELNSFHQKVLRQMFERFIAGEKA